MELPEKKSRPLSKARAHVSKRLSDTIRSKEATTATTIFWSRNLLAWKADAQLRLVGSRTASSQGFRPSRHRFRFNPQTVQFLHLLGSIRTSSFRGSVFG